jgi:hypothetical protein
MAPDATRAGLDQVHSWVATHQRLVIATIAATVGVYLIAVGSSNV